ncbi:unnamed protein product [Umbelopsis vinacea]
MPLARQQVKESDIEISIKMRSQKAQHSIFGAASGKVANEIHILTRPKFRCNIERDAGTTAGSTIPSHTFVSTLLVECVHKGLDKYLEYKKDMGGVGSFNFDNRTLYVGRVTVNEDMESTVRRHFSEWGALESVKVLKRRGVAFVTYQMRSNAEWASDDPNPTPAVSEAPEKKRKTEAQYTDDGESDLPAEYTSRTQEVDEDGFMNMEMRIKLERAAEAERQNRSLQEQAAALNYWNYYQQPQPVTSDPTGEEKHKDDKQDSIFSSKALESLKLLQKNGLPTDAAGAKKGNGGLQALANYGSDSEDED